MNLTELINHPDDTHRFQVFADQLSEQGDPRGEFISIQLKREQHPTDATLAAREAALLEAHLVRWVGEKLAALARTGITRARQPDLHHLALTWKRGFLDSVRIGPPTDTYETAAIDFPATIKDVLSRESAALLQELVIGSIDYDDYPTSWQPCVDALVESTVPATLRRLEFNRGGYWDISSTELGDVSALWPKLSGLRELSIEMGAMTLGALDLPALTKLEIVTGQLTDENLAEVANAKMPQLESLTLCLGNTDGDHGCTATAEGLEPLYASANFPKLKHLGIANTNLADAVAARVATAPVLKRLTSLDLSRGTLGAEGAQHLLAHRAAFAHLEVLDLHRNFIPTDLFPQLSSLAKKVVLDEMESSELDYRYVAISE